MPTIGVVVARTGRLAPLGTATEFVADLLRARLRGRRPVAEVVVRDSGSTASGARAATEALVDRDGATVVLSMGGTATLPAVAATCERLATPCVSTVLPWQVLLRSLGTVPRWSYHFCWGIDDIAAVFADIWQQVAPQCVVGCLWNDGAQGAALRHPDHGFVGTAEARGHRLVDPAGYAEGEADFDAHISAFLDHDARVVTSAATAADLAVFLARAAERGLRPRLVTCSRWLTYPFGVARYGLDRVATIVSWTPAHRHRSSLDGSSPAELARSYELATGRQWLQPLGLAHALFEVALHALDSADDPADRSSVVASLRRTKLATLAGTLDWTAGPAPNVATIPLAGGQWHASSRPHLAVVTNTRAPAAPHPTPLTLPP